MQSAAIRIGTRGSPLALAQAEEVRAALAAVQGMEPAAFAILPIRTSGDRITDRPLAEAGGKGLFTKEIDEALLSGEIDIAVHSAKDIATRLPAGIVIAACLKRQDVRDAFISTTVKRLADLPEGAVLGTSSPRRKALALRVRPDLTVVDLRGNVETRLRKINEGQAAATLLAAAGLLRLGMSDRAASYMEPAAWLPAPGQGTVAIAARVGDAAMREKLASIDNRTTSIALAAERAFLDILDGSCRTPIGGLATLLEGQLTFGGIIVRPDGRDAREVRIDGEVEDAVRIGRTAGETLARRGGADFFASS